MNCTGISCPINPFILKPCKESEKSKQVILKRDNKYYAITNYSRKNLNNNQNLVIQSHTVLAIERFQILINRGA